MPEQSPKPSPDLLPDPLREALTYKYISDMDTTYIASNGITHFVSPIFYGYINDGLDESYIFMEPLRGVLLSKYYSDVLLDTKDIIEKYKSLGSVDVVLYAFNVKTYPIFLTDISKLEAYVECLKRILHDMNAAIRAINILGIIHKDTHLGNFFLLLKDNKYDHLQVIDYGMATPYKNAKESMYNIDHMRTLGISEMIQQIEINIKSFKELNSDYLRVTEAPA